MTAIVHDYCFLPMFTIAVNNVGLSYDHADDMGNVPPEVSSKKGNFKFMRETPGFICSAFSVEPLIVERQSFPHSLKHDL